MFINVQGQPSKDARVRRMINLHLSKIAKSKRRSKYDINEEDVDQQRLREAPTSENLKTKKEPTKDRAVTRLINTGPAPLPVSVASLHPRGRYGEIVAKACRDYFTLFCHSDMQAQGLSPARRNAYAATLFAWSSEHDLMFSALAAWRFYCLPGSSNASPHSISFGSFDAPRALLMRNIHDKLEKQEVDDMLILSICIAMTIDHHLEYQDFEEAHLKGIDTVIKLRGGFESFGTSVPEIADTLRYSAVLAISAVRLASELESPRLTSLPSASLRYHWDSGVETSHQLLPAGFQCLSSRRYFSQSMIDVLLSFQTWWAAHDETKTDASRSWRGIIPPGLAKFEKIIFAVLTCLGDDVSGIGIVYEGPMWRRTKQRMGMIKKETVLWQQGELSDLLIWLVTVVVSPRQIDTCSVKERNELLDQTKELRPDLENLKAVERILRRFFFCESRATAWRQVWTVRLPCP